ncbi:hypothetical protein [Propionivibrio sp.]|uniref:hypothetical protein n=1 Tax=Propionivibrio sp. TaxID=2212460 RepID=UPI003BF2CD1B
MRTSDTYENNQIDELDPGFRRGDELEDLAEMIFSQSLSPRQDGRQPIKKHSVIQTALKTTPRLMANE